MAERVIDEVCEEPGTAAAFSSQRLERIHRDVAHISDHVLRQWRPSRSPGNTASAFPRSSTTVTELQRPSSSLTLCERRRPAARAQTHGAERQRAKPPRHAQIGASGASRTPALEGTSAHRLGSFWGTVPYRWLRADRRIWRARGSKQTTCARATCASPSRRSEARAVLNKTSAC